MPRLTAAEIARALGGHRSGKGFVARCPAHDDRAPSLSIADGADGADGKILIHCFAGCSQGAVIAALRTRGLWLVRGFPRDRKHAGRYHHANSTSDEQAAQRRDFALAIWEQGRPITGTLAETYLRSRGIIMQLPLALRFHERLRHAPTNGDWPAMVALITDSITAEPIGIHRTYLSADGSGKAPVEPAKMMLGSAKGGVVQLAHPSDAVMVAEGIETALSVQQACGVPTWAALSAQGLKALNLPPGVTTVTLLADGDQVGEAAALAAARRLRNAVRSVRVVRAPSGSDFNDVLTRKTDED